MKKKEKCSKKSSIGVFAAITLIFLSSAAAQQKQPDVPFVPTPDKVVTEMLRMAQVSKDDVLYDLGCGDGRIVITAAKEFGCRGVGIDIDPERIKESRENAIAAGVSDRVRFIQMDLFEAEISEATVVTLYLLSEVNLRLRPKLLKELNPGTRVVSHQFSMGEWDPDASSSVKTGDYWDEHVEDFWNEHFIDYWSSHEVYLWIIPGNVTGTWKLTIPDISGKNEFTLKFDQEFQKVKGETFEGQSVIPLFIKEEKIKGNMLQFTLEREVEGRTENWHFEGKLRGYIMQGTLNIEGSPVKQNLKWEARRAGMTLRSIIRSGSYHTEISTH
jgi:SAM-dependent methyltransferase